MVGQIRSESEVRIDAMQAICNAKDDDLEAKDDALKAIKEVGLFRQDERSILRNHSPISKIEPDISKIRQARSKNYFRMRRIHASRPKNVLKRQ